MINTAVENDPGNRMYKYLWSDIRSFTHAPVPIRDVENPVLTAENPDADDLKSNPSTSLSKSSKSRYIRQIS